VRAYTVIYIVRVANERPTYPPVYNSIVVVARDHRHAMELCREAVETIIPEGEVDAGYLNDWPQIVATVEGTEGITLNEEGD
jgi:hypothetical protein